MHLVYLWSCFPAPLLLAVVLCGYFFHYRRMFY
ncbi:Loki-CTERM sorting domain-containing protein [Chitinophaga sp. MD30]